MQRLEKLYKYDDVSMVVILGSFSIFLILDFDCNVLYIFLYIVFNHI